MVKASNTTAEVEILSGKAVIDAMGLEDLLRKLAEVRAELRPEVQPDLEKNVTVLAEVDPGWRTYPNLHPGISGLTLNLRHSGYGCLGSPCLTPRP